MTELETIDSKIKAKENENIKKEEELRQQEHKLATRIGPIEFEKY
jgi:hypothetical protein